MRFSFVRRSAPPLLVWHSHSEPAAYRCTPEENEDAIAVQWHPQDSQAVICALADGAGGQSGGQAAARLAVTSALQTMSGSRRLLDERLYTLAVTSADAAIAEDAEAGFTTLIVATVTAGKVIGASCGDSMALLIRGDASSLELTEQQRKNPPVGSGAAVPVSFSAPFQTGDCLLLVSDGVWRYVGVETITATCRGKTPEEIPAVLRTLQTATSAGNLSDDFSIIIVAGIK